MTPEERRELADRLDRAAALNERTAKEMGGLGRGWANAAADLRAAAAALREMPSTEEVVTAARASLWEQMESEAVERLTAERDAALAKVADLNAEITQLGSDIEDAYAERAAFSAEVARLRERLADAVVIPRSAIPDDLPGDLLEMAEEVSECRRVLGDHDRLVTAARLLSGGATEGDER